MSDRLKASIRSMADDPKPGILFRDMTTLLGNARAFRRAAFATNPPRGPGKHDLENILGKTDPDGGNLFHGRRSPKINRFDSNPSWHIRCR